MLISASYHKETFTELKMANIKRETPPKGHSIEDYLATLDNELLQYVPDLRRLGFTSSTALKFFKFSDLEAFSSKVSIGHRRMLLNAAEKLKTPGSKMGISPDVGSAVGNKRPHPDDTEDSSSSGK